MADDIKWPELIKTLNQMGEQEVINLLNYENSTNKRPSYVKRLHQRYCKLRDAREREEILAGRLL